MVDRSAGRASWTLDPYQVRVSYAARTAGSGWFGPLAPMAPAAPPEVAGRQWDYPAGFNLSLGPRAAEPVGFQTLRRLADGWDLLRLVVETRKDQIGRMAWSIGPRPGAAPDPETAGRATAFFRRPDGLHGWVDWLRILLEELFVIDAPALYCRRDRAGRLAALLPLDGATIKPVIDAWGRTPQPFVEDGRTTWPVAYQQVLHGLPAVDYSTRDLLYRPRNPRVSRAYGYSPVEQILATVNIALRRQLFLTEYFTEGNIPDSLIGVPDNWSADQIASYQTYWDSYFSGEAGKRRRAKFVPGAVAHSFIQTKEPELKTIFDDWLARLVCFAFSVSPQALVSQMNRATAEVQKTLSEEEGLAPVLAWIKGPRRRTARRGVRRAGAGIRVGPHGQRRPRGAGADAVELHVARHPHAERGARGSGARSAGGAGGRRAAGADGDGVCGARAGCDTVRKACRGSQSVQQARHLG